MKVAGIACWGFASIHKIFVAGNIGEKKLPVTTFADYSTC
jgi:hypothetical protein